MDLFQKIRNNYYEPKQEYPSKGMKNKILCPTCGQFMKNNDGELLYRKMRKEYLEEEGRLYDEFRKDAIEYVGLTGHPKADKIYDKAWEDGHSCGYEEVLIHLEELADLVK